MDFITHWAEGGRKGRERDVPWWEWAPDFSFWMTGRGDTIRGQEELIIGGEKIMICFR